MLDIDYKAMSEGSRMIKAAKTQSDLFGEPPDVKQLRYRIQRYERMLAYWLALPSWQATEAALGALPSTRKGLIAQYADDLQALRAELAAKLNPA
jgi:hypothetical protein